MSCEPSQTSPVLDCICVKGKPLIDYIDTGDQTLQTLILNLQQTIAALQQCCTTNSANITALQATMAAIQAAIAILQANMHSPLLLTKNQDVANRATLIDQVLTLPPALAARILATGLAQTLAGNGQIQPITGLRHDFDTWSTTAAGAVQNSITVPRAGRYNLTVGWGTNNTAVNSAGVAATDSVDFITGQATLGATVGINGSWAGRFTNPSSPYLAESVVGIINGHFLQAGDVLTVGAYVDVAGIVVNSAYLALAYIEGTES